MPTTPLALSFAPVKESDFESLLGLRVAAMRQSLERLGRFDPERARARFQESFAPSHTRQVLLGGERVGFLTLRPDGGSLLLDHLYVDPPYQNRGVGSALLALVFAEADAARLELRVGALRDSDSNRFYLRHGFERVAETEWDIHYVRRACSKSAQ